MKQLTVRALAGFAFAAAVAASPAGVQNNGATQSDKAAQQQGTRQGGSAGGSKGAGGGAAQGKAAGPAMVYMLIPVAIASRANAAGRLASSTNSLPSE